jgi:hypothetical protein
MSEPCIHEIVITAPGPAIAVLQVDTLGPPGPPGAPLPGGYTFGLSEDLRYLLLKQGNTIVKKFLALDP